MSSVPTTARPPQGSRGRAWPYAALAAAAYAVWTLVPLELAALDARQLFEVALDDVVGNLLMAVPIGWLFANAVGHRRAPFLMLGLVIAVEGAQLFLQTRSAALSDVVANTLGAAIGALWWRRPHTPSTADAMLVAVTCWGVALRYGAPGRPVLTVGLLLALAMALVRAEPARSEDAAGFALVSVAGFAGLAPVPLLFAALAATTLGALLAAPLRAWRRPIAALAPVVYVLETWPPFRVAEARAADLPLMVTEVALLAAATLALVSPRRADRSLPAGS